MSTTETKVGLARAWTLAVALVMLGCPQGPTTVPDDEADGAPEPDLPPIVPDEPANHAAGDPIDVVIPLVGGESLDLDTLRGHPVLIEISASWEPGWHEAHALYAELLAEHPELEIIVVSAEPDDQALLELPEGLRPGWDPAGALAAKLSVATFPTMIVVDRDGVVSTIVNGWDDSVEAGITEAVDGLF